MAENKLISGGSENKDMNKVISYYSKYWYLFLIGIILCIGIAYWYVNYEAVPEYRISSTLLVKDKDKGSGASDMEAIADLGLVKPIRNVEDEIGILKSSSLMEKALQDLSMQVKYSVPENISEEKFLQNLPVTILVDDSETLEYNVPIYIKMKDEKTFELYETNGGDKSVHSFQEKIRKPWGTFTVVKSTAIPASNWYSTISFYFQDIAAIADYYSKQLTVLQLTQAGGLLEISIVHPVPEQGEEILAQLIEAYRREAVAYRNELASSTIAMIDERLDFLTGELSNVEKNVEQFKRENALTNVNSDAELYLEKASEYNRQLAEYQTQIDVLNSIESYLSTEDGDGAMVPSSLNIQDPTLVGLISRFNDLQLERKRMLQTTPKSNPLVVDIDRQLTSLRSNILENLRNIKNGLIITSRNLAANTRRYESQIAKVPTVERGLLEINRQQSTKEGLYLYLLQKREEEALSMAAPVSNSRIIDAPKAGNYPVSPNKTSIYLGALIFGLFLPFSVIYVKEKINDKIGDTSDIQELTDTPILGEIAHNREKEKMVVGERNTTPVAELFRLIRFNLKFVSAGKANKVILVTSGMKGEGKTFFTLNLGASLAISGKKVVALSFDLRAPKLMRTVGLSDDFGISDFIINENIEASEIVVPSPEIKGLSFIGSGPIPPNAGELMLSNRIEVLIDELKKEYDYVLIDSAPVGKVADGFALAPYVDSTIYIVRHNVTRRRQLKTLDDIYRTGKLKRPMVVLNGIKTQEAYGYGYGAREKQSTAYKVRTAET
ncbi:polysaccharide biosynthesis tyrosine autokinase [Zunongwangia sp. F260]|uniref:non-specific protein-tyrosine kinase n=1 Tax=Autumnicola lenta TaxID=3075593 RepID=A0ABU3CI95_9FLAO|nr:polysaccharide biosynthesis tyrosine autokinase [Zunongwangia sp. F260]MDT0646073.1 polysaccharide biosynthesis tyrosine autokinase [Zunongwangia sp. F260]